MDVTPFTISKHLTDLVGRHVAVKVHDALELAPATRAACYTVEPMDGTALVQLDFPLLATLAGGMICVPNGEIESQIKDGKLDENMTDAAGELMNVLSAVIVGQGRAIFKGLFKEAREYSAKAQDLLKGGFFPLRLQVTPQGGKPGSMVIVSDVM